MSKEPLFVTCPVCGKVNQKSLFTYSEVRCQRCHIELTAFADLGVVVGIDMNKKRSKEEVAILCFASDSDMNEYVKENPDCYENILSKAKFPQDYLE